MGEFRINVLGPELNDNDNSLIDLCFDAPRSVGELSKLLDIANKNVINRLVKLEEKQLILINRQGRGKKTLVSANKENADVELIHTGKKMERWMNDPCVPKEHKESFMRIMEPHDDIIKDTHET